ncbi:hypothetical protein ACKI1H_27115 [Pseudomonas sp. YH-1]|uniref:hypothetical protein n=1 Tax=Pseudomonas sp. YH-1 TaxID=3384787 RepID=UPI003F8053EA
MTDKYLAAIVRHERAAQANTRLSREIGEALAKCPVNVELGKWETTQTRRAELTAQGGRSKTHVWMALNFTDIGSHGYPVRLHMEEIADFLAEDPVCEHCQRAWQLVIQRKQTREELGNAKRAIRNIGRAALAKEALHG